MFLVSFGELFYRELGSRLPFFLGVDEGSRVIGKLTVSIVCLQNKKTTNRDFLNLLLGVLDILTSKVYDLSVVGDIGVTLLSVRFSDLNTFLNTFFYP